MLKNILKVFLLLFLIKGNAQHARAFINLSCYSHSDFKGNIFAEVGAGTEVKVHRLFKPEVGISCFAGNLEDYTSKLDEQGNALDLRISKANAVNLNFTPKISLFAKEASAGDVFLQILPRFNLAKITAERSYTVVDQNKPSQYVTTTKRISEWQSSFGIGLGLDIVLSDKNYDSLSINVYYNGVDMGKALIEVNNSTSRVDTKTVGAGVSYYKGFEKKK